MDRYLSRYAEYIYALLRIVSGFLFLQHGTQKFFDIPASGKPPVPMSAVIGAAAAIEIIAGVMILIGFFAGFAAFVESGEMAVAYFMVHQPMGALPIQNQGELAVVYCFLFLYIASRGSGILSVDAMMGRESGVRAVSESPPTT
jgi:putative oxidoreductase